MKKSFIAIAIISGIVIGAIIGFGGLAALSHTGIKADSKGTATTIITKPADVISTSDAKSIVLNKVPGGVITNFYFANGDVSTYDATVVNGKNEYSVKVNAKTGDISSFDKTSSDFKGTVADVNAGVVSQNGFISSDKAKEIALAKVPNSDITGISLNYEGITPEYDLVLTNATNKVYICLNAKTGDIISNNSMPIASTTTN